MSFLTRIQNTRVVNVFDDDWTYPPYREDPLPQHLGWIDGLPACDSEPCRHGWPVMQSRPEDSGSEE